MGGVVDTVGGFLGLSGGPQAPGVKSGSEDLDKLLYQNRLYGSGADADLLSQYANGSLSSNDVLSKEKQNDGSFLGGPEMQFEMQNALASSPLTGSRYASEQIQEDPILGSLFAKGGALNQAEDKLTQLENQGYRLTDDDNTLYGQAAGSIARQYGQAGNQLSAELASRGLSSAPSGSAGASFSGLMGNEREALANAQTAIMQQRFSNTLAQINQQQQMVEALGGQAGNDIQNQFGRQLAGVQTQKQNLAQAAGLQLGDNSAANNANMAAANFNVANTPKNFATYMTTGAGQGLQAGSGGAFASMFGGGGGGQAANPSTATAANNYGAGDYFAGSAPPAAGGMGAGAGAFSLFSDARLKTNVKSAQDEISEILESMSPYKFNYKDPRHGAGDFYGVMAQDLETTPAGRSLVVNTQDGKAIDTNKALSLILASIAVLASRVSALEVSHG